jgi:outer membrane protein assembly factor BamA
MHEKPTGHSSSGTAFGKSSSEANVFMGIEESCVIGTGNGVGVVCTVSSLQKTSLWAPFGQDYFSEMKMLYNWSLFLHRVVIYIQNKLK